MEVLLKEVEAWPLILAHMYAVLDDEAWPDARNTSKLRIEDRQQGERCLFNLGHR